jgi:hypothetical protein
VSKPKRPKSSGPEWEKRLQSRNYAMAGRAGFDPDQIERRPVLKHDPEMAAPAEGIRAFTR